MKNRLAWILCLALTTSGCGLRLGHMSATQKGERLAVERARLTEITDPADKTKSYIRISQILLSFASEAANEGDLEDMHALIEQYIMTIRSARDTIVASDRDAERHPAGYTDLEIALRGQVRLLQDINRDLFAENRDAVDQAIKVAGSIREEILQLLFPKSIPLSLLVS